MLKFLLLSVLCTIGFGLPDARAQTLHPVDSESEVTFFINNFGSPVKGSFRGLKGNLQFDAAHPEAGSMEVTVDAATIETGINMRNRHLRGDKYFAAELYPRIMVRASNIRPGKDGGTFVMDAKITIKSVTRTIPLVFRAVSVDGGKRFEGSFNINRRDFGVGGGSISLSDEVTIRLKVVARH